MKEEQERSKENGTRRITSVEKAGDEEELVDGWPKWLIDNIPSDALAGLTPRSAETYDKIDKVSLFFLLFMEFPDLNLL